MNLGYTYYSDVKDGKLQPIITKRLLNDLKQFEGKRVELSLKKKVSSRSQQQNKYYWVLCGILSSELGYTKQEVHDLLKFKFLKRNIIIGQDEEVIVKSTAALTKSEFGDFVAEIQEWAATLNIILPDPGQQMEIFNN